MRIYEIITEEELDELQIVDRILNNRELQIAERLFDQMVYQGSDETEAFHQAAKLANVREKLFQRYLQNHNKFSH